MAATVYDQHAAFYVEFVEKGLASDDGYVALLRGTVRGLLGGRLAGARICDLCCGEGYVGRFLLAEGAREVVGIDLAAELVAVAQERAPVGPISYRVDDARTLASVADGEFDVVVSQMAMMDVADHRAMFAAVRRVLAPGGLFVFTMLHPCFEGRPFHVTDAPPFLFDDAGLPTAYVVRRYATEGHWNSGGDGVRGRMGAWHRTLSTYVNDLIAAGFVLERLEEPLAGFNATRIGVMAEVPTVLAVAARAA
jgi:2-polyprenyl-3-methyl-5-hydroxy-6-metoxy-1,4-benzoquinol methylase